MAKFKTQARALDLLGRQQIAGIPTAINELIKNAYDAYADHFSADFLRAENLLILRDDGIGMTYDEFTKRWLTLGTDSKVASNPIVDPTKEKRPVMGAKGIGRLAIALVGSQVLILSKSKHNDSAIIACYIDWRVFELPYLDLDDIDIPVIELLSFPDKQVVKNLCQAFSIGLCNIKVVHPELITKIDEIISAASRFSCDPAELNEKLPGSIFNFNQSTGGTHFYISTQNSTLASDIDNRESPDEATKMEKMLIGFHNTMTPNHESPKIEIKFRDYKDDSGSYTTLIDEEEFFTPDDFKLADHHFSGCFDAYGQFKGTISVYGKEMSNQIVPWMPDRVRKTQCGPFKISLAYLQGEQKSSMVKKEDYDRIRAKGDKYGGLYIYRNNIRVLPYGNSDYDFIDIERNRSKRAGTYFFSYRRMFGAIELNDKDNKNLIEKAGREGFIENTAYKQMRAILKNFFERVAYDYFASNSSELSEYYNSKKNEINKINLAIEKREQRSKERKAKFTSELNKFFTELNDGVFKKNVDEILVEFKLSLNSVKSLNNPPEIVQTLIDLEPAYNKRIKDYYKSIIIQAPRGVALTRRQREDFGIYLSEIKKLDQELFTPAYDTISTYIERVSAEKNVSIGKKQRLVNAINNASFDALSDNRRKRQEADEAAKKACDRAVNITRELLINLDTQIKKVKDQFKNIFSDDDSTDEYVAAKKRLELEIESTRAKNTSIMEQIIKQFENITFEKLDDDSVITGADIAEATAEEIEDLKEKLQSDLELSQLGLAVGIINHEFNSAVKAIKSSLADLKEYADIETTAEKIYTNIKTSFDHLEIYLRLFDPLSPQLNREQEEIKLKDAYYYVKDMFETRLARHNIALLKTYGIDNTTIYGYRSVIYPVFVNIVDNAIYWLSQCNVHDKKIVIHAADGIIYISNNGPKISIQDEDHIFEMRFSRKPNGRGMGLAISKDILDDNGYTLQLAVPRKGMNVTFMISERGVDDGRIGK